MSANSAAGLVGKGYWEALREVSSHLPTSLQPQLARCCQDLDLGGVSVVGPVTEAVLQNFQDGCISAVRMRESSWAESLAKSSGKVMFIHWECLPQ